MSKILIVTPCRIEFDSALLTLKERSNIYEKLNNFENDIFYFSDFNLYLGMGGHARI